MNNKQIKRNLLTIMLDRVKLQDRKGNLKEWFYKDYKTGEQLIKDIHNYIDTNLETNEIADILKDGYKQILQSVFDILPSEKDLDSAIVQSIEIIDKELENINYYEEHENFQVGNSDEEIKERMYQNIKNLKELINRLEKNYMYRKRNDKRKLKINRIKYRVHS
jgi:hypothetical protein